MPTTLLVLTATEAWVRPVMAPVVPVEPVEPAVVDAPVVPAEVPVLVPVVLVPVVEVVAPVLDDVELLEELDVEDELLDSAGAAGVVALGGRRRQSEYWDKH